MKKNKIKLLAASALLAGNIVLLPGCYKVFEGDDQGEKTSVLQALNDFDYLSGGYSTERKVEKIYGKINDNSVKVKQILGQTDLKNYTFYTTGSDVMVIVQGKKPTVWFSSNVTPSDAYSAIASYNEMQGLKGHEFFEYLNPRDFKYLVNDNSDYLNIVYSDGGKLEINVDDDVYEIVVCEVTPSVIKNFSEANSEEYILKQNIDYNIPAYALVTLRCFEQLPDLYMKDNDTLSVTYDGNYYETYIGFAEKDFSSIPFFGFAFNAFEKNNNVIYKA